MQRNVIHFADERFSTKENSTIEEDVKFSMPHFITLGFAWKKNLNLYLDNELIIGHYGGKKLKYMEFWILRAGIEKKFSNAVSLCFGLTTPIIAKASSLGNIRSQLPNPKFNISAGCGYQMKYVNLNLALFINPGQSYVQRKPVPALYISGIYHFDRLKNLEKN